MNLCLLYAFLKLFVQLQSQNHCIFIWRNSKCMIHSQLVETSVSRFRFEGCLCVRIFQNWVWFLLFEILAMSKQRKITSVWPVPWQSPYHYGKIFQDKNISSIKGETSNKIVTDVDFVISYYDGRNKWWRNVCYSTFLRFILRCYRSHWTRL